MCFFKVQLWAPLYFGNWTFGNWTFGNRYFGNQCNLAMNDIHLKDRWITQLFLFNCWYLQAIMIVYHEDGQIFLNTHLHLRSIPLQTITWQVLTNTRRILSLYQWHSTQFKVLNAQLKIMFLHEVLNQA